MLSSQQFPIHIAARDGVLSKGQKTFNSNIQQIEKLRTSLAAWDAASTAYHEKYARELVPLVSASMELQAMLVKKLDCVSDAKGLGKRERYMLVEAIMQLVEELLNERDDAEMKAIYNKYSQSDYDSEEAANLQSKEDMFGFDWGKDDDDGYAAMEEALQKAHAQYEAGQQAQEAQRTKRKKSAKQVEKEALEEAEAKQINLSLRDIYRKLASALHPDRASDPQERERRTLLMQRVNQAYEKNNLLQLLELQLELEHIDRIAFSGLDEDRLRHYNTILKSQINELKVELMRVESGFCGQFGMSPFARVKPATVLRDLGYDILHMKQANSALEYELTTLTDAKSVKAWLKKIRHEAENRPYNDCPF